MDDFYSELRDEELNGCDWFTPSIRKGVPE